MKTVLTIAGSDSVAGAGIQADIKTFAAHGVYGTSAVTAVTAQNTLGVSSVFPLPADVVTAQIEAVTSDLEIDAAKTGMLATAAVVEAVAAAIEALDIPRVVVDPVVLANDGAPLLEDEAVAVLKTQLLPRAYVVTPNALEAARLTGLTVSTLDDARAAARRVLELGPSAVIIKGGHLKQADAVDLMFDGREFIELRAPRLDTPRGMHGTGCAFSAALAANLALGHTLRQAAVLAKEYVTGAIRNAVTLGRGRTPPHHFWRSG